MERKVLFPLILMLVFAASRWHTVDQEGNLEPLLPYNFSAAHALLFCAAFWLPGWLGWVLPMATIIVTDLLLNSFVYNEPLLLQSSIPIWITLGIFVVLAKWLAKRRSYGRFWGRFFLFIGMVSQHPLPRPLVGSVLARLFRPNARGTICRS